MNALAATLVLLALNGAFAAPEQCTFYAFDGCRCHTDTATLDISEYFNYPVVVEDPAEKYTFTYSPCEPLECGPGEPAVVCQRGAGETYALGRLDNSTSWYVESYYPLQFTIHYYNGDPSGSGHREALVNMLHDNSAMSAVFINEDPVLVYNFGVTGNKVVAEQEICTFDPAESCRCQTDTVSLDISEYFKYPVELKGQDVWSYIYSPCTPIPCGDESVAMCQVWPSQDVYHTVGVVDSSTVWYVNSYNPLQFTIHYFGGEEDRNAVVNMSYENTAMSAKFISEIPLHTYHFSITGNEVVAKPSPNRCTFYPSENCRCHTDTISLDISDYFQYPVKMEGQDVYSYIYSPCTPIRCGTKAATVCQVWESQEIYHVSGRVDNSTIWYVNSYNPLQFTIHYFGGEEGRNAEFKVSYENTDMSVKFRSENPLLTYHFDITGNKVVPSSAARITLYTSDGSPALQNSLKGEEQGMQEEGGSFSSCTRAGFDKLVLLGALVLHFLILPLTGSGYSAISAKEDILC